MKTISIIILLVGIEYQVFAQKTITYTDQKFEYKLYIMPYTDVDDSSNNSYCTIQKINIFTKYDKKEIQQLIPVGTYFYCDRDSVVFSLVDANFDGYNDLQIFDLKGTSGTLYFFWLYNFSKNKFERNSELEALSRPEFDEKSKSIYSSFFNNRSSGQDTYKYIHGKLTMTERVRNSVVIDKNGNEKEITTVHKLINGKMKLFEKF